MGVGVGEGGGRGKGCCLRVGRVDESGGVTLHVGHSPLQKVIHKTNLCLTAL